MAPSISALTSGSNLKTSGDVHAQTLGIRPPQVPFDVDRYPVAPPDLELEQVHIFVRHGERTPVGIRMSAPPASIPEHWMMCKTGRQFRAAVAGLTQPQSDQRFPNTPVSSTTLLGDSIPVMAEPVSEGEGPYMRMRRVVERIDGSSVDGECMLGELTDVGRQSTYNFGVALRSLYVDKLGFLPDKLNRYEDVYFRSTNMPRTVESLQQIIHGLYPIHKFSPGVIPRIFVRNGKDENLLGNAFACKRLEILLLGFAQAAASAYNHTLETLDKKLSQYIGGNPIRIDGKPRASGILDTIRACTAHGVPVPPEFQEKSTMDLIEKAVCNEWFAGYKTEEVRRLGMGRLLDEMVRKMFSKATSSTDRNIKSTNEGKDPKILVHSTHDAALAAICSTFDVYDEKWPAFTASISFELYRQKSISPPPSILQSLTGMILPFKGTRRDEHFVRMRYQNRSMMLPICASEGAHLPGSPEFCTLEAFRARVAEITPKDWDTECMPLPPGSGRL